MNAIEINLLRSIKAKVVSVILVYLIIGFQQVLGQSVKPIGGYIEMVASDTPKYAMAKEHVLFDKGSQLPDSGYIKFTGFPLSTSGYIPAIRRINNEDSTYEVIYANTYYIQDGAGFKFLFSKSNLLVGDSTKLYHFNLFYKYSYDIGSLGPAVAYSPPICIGPIYYPPSELFHANLFKDFLDPDRLLASNFINDSSNLGTAVDNYVNFESETGDFTRKSLIGSEITHVSGIGFNIGGSSITAVGATAFKVDSSIAGFFQYDTSYIDSLGFLSIFPDEGDTSIGFKFSYIDSTLDTLSIQAYSTMYRYDSTFSKFNSKKNGDTITVTYSHKLDLRLNYHLPGSMTFHFNTRLKNGRNYLRMISFVLRPHPDATGIKLINKFERETLHIYPNPAGNQISINASGKYIIYDAIGRDVHSGETNGHISVGLLQSGSYLIKLINQNGVYFGKFVKKE